MTRSRARRNRRKAVKQWEQDEATRAQESNLEAEESALLNKQRWVSGLAYTVASIYGPRAISTSDIQGAFDARFGPAAVSHVSIKYRKKKNRHQNAQRSASSHQFPAVLGAVIEFRDAAVAQQADASRITVDIGREYQQQQVLEMPSIGYLLDSGRPVRYSSKFVRFQPNRVPSSQYYHRGGGGQHILAAEHLLIGSYGPDGSVVITEHHAGGDSYQAESITVDLQKRELCIRSTLGTSETHLLVHPFRNLRRRMLFDRSNNTLTFTAAKPPKVLQWFFRGCRGCGLGDDGYAINDPLYQLAGDPTASHNCGMNLSQYCTMCQVYDWLAWQDELLAAAYGFELGYWPDTSAPLVGSGLAGADGLLGRCLTYRVTLHSPAITELFADNNKLLKKLRSFRLLESAAPQHQQQHQMQIGNGTRLAINGALSQAQFKHTSKSMGIESRGNWEAAHGPCRLTELLDLLTHHQEGFMVGYHVLVLLTKRVATIWQVTEPAFVQLLQQAATSDPELACKALSELADSGSPVKDAAEALEKHRVGLMEYHAAGANSSSASIKVLRVRIYPSGVEFLQPETESGNRVLRHFCSSPDDRDELGGPTVLGGLQFNSTDFVRASFGDESGDKLLGTKDEEGTAFYQRMSYVLENGLMVNGRKFAFLAYSSSQLKSWSCWMVAVPQHASCDLEPEAVAAALRAWLGDAMQTERIPAKCAARVGQGFSTTVDAARVLPQEAAQMNDIERNGYCFSDGVGRISPRLLEEVLVALPYASVEKGPISAVQVRFQGCKGVLAKHSGLSGRQLQYRPSMRKFGSIHPQLEVCSVAAWLPAYLNRQVIIFMSNNGVQDEVFMNKLEQQLDELQAMCETPQQAFELLPKLGGIEPIAHRALVQLLGVMVTCGVRMFDPLTKSCLEAIARWQVTDLRNKGRLLVHDGAVLMGIMDEHNVLREGEVFVQVQLPIRNSEPSPQPQIRQGKVLLAKHPVAHRGDVRVVDAVEPRGRPGGQRLVQDYVNVVVFSQQGARPLPNMLAGSDLDGDQYMVLWDQELLQPHNADPMDYTAQPPDAVNEVNVKHLTNHFVAHAINDRLGQISTWLLAQADMAVSASKRDGFADWTACDRLAELHSTAVDFPKTGRPAVIGPEDFKQLYPEAFPHWLEKHDKPCYESTTILGQMFDRIKEHPLSTRLLAPGSTTHQTQQDNSTSRINMHHHRTTAAGVTHQWPQQLLSVAGASSSYTDTARQHFDEFEADLSALMNHWSAWSVGELLTACLPSLQRRQVQHHQQSEQRDLLNRQLRKLHSDARLRYVKTVLQSGGAVSSEVQLQGLNSRQLEAMVSDRCNSNSKLQLAAAYLIVAYKHASKHTAAQQLSQAASVQQDGHLSDQGLSDEEEWSDVSTDADDDQAMLDQSEQQKQQDRAYKSRDIKQRVRLCFAWVVSKELQELSGRL